jgi:hypothetical protein
MMSSESNSAVDNAVSGALATNASGCGGPSDRSFQPARNFQAAIAELTWPHDTNKKHPPVPAHGPLLTRSKTARKAGRVSYAASKTWKWLRSCEHARAAGYVVGSNIARQHCAAENPLDLAAGGGET